MHYRNGREAKNGDPVAQIGEGGKIIGVGTLQNAVPGNDYCNGEVLIRSGPGCYGPAIIVGACMCDCLHVDDVAAMLAEKCLDNRPTGK